MKNLCLLPGRKPATLITIKTLLFILKLTIFLFFAPGLPVCAKGNGQNISISQRNTTLEKVFKEIHQKTGYQFFYQVELLHEAKKFDINVKNASIERVLELCFKDQPLNFIITEKTITIQRKEESKIPDVPPKSVLLEVVGKVKDENGQPLAGVSVTIVGEKGGISTDINGNFSISVTKNAVLSFSFIGYETVTVPVNGRTNIDVTLTRDVSSLNDVVVVGYGTQKKVNLTGAVDVVSTEVLKDRASANIGALLQGASPNLNILVNLKGGEPGAGLNFNIRGIGSLTGSNSPLILVDGVELNINNIDPESIENISILKDAASAAIYGSRAPFGVVLITTKKGSKNKGVSISYSNNIAVASPISLPKWQSSLRYVTAYNQSLENSGQPDKFGPAQIDRIKRYIAGTYTPEYDTINPPSSIWAGRHEGNANYDWFDVYFKDQTINQKHNVSISGGDEKTQYYVSTGFYDQGSSYNWVNEYYKRYNVLANITSQATSWLRLNVNTKYANTKSSHPNLGSDWDPDRTFLISEMIKFFPTTTFYNIDGTINNPYVLAMQQAGPAIGNENDLYLGLGGEIEPIPGWKTNFNYNYNYTGNKNTWLDKELYAELPDGQKNVAFWLGSPDYYTQNWQSNNYTSFNGYTSYEKSIHNHFFKAMVGYERELRNFATISGVRYGLINPSVPSFGTGTGASYIGDASSHWATEAYFGRLNYNYGEKYLLEVNGRYNGSSRFAKDSRWGFFPSVSAGYNISKESFWRPLRNFVSNLKIRGSYGSLGNQNVPNYLYLSNIPINSNLPWILDNQLHNYAGLPAIISPTLTWETVSTLDFGVDASFLNNRLGLSFDWYKRNTSNMFGPSTILPASLGTSPPQENNASLSTKGWEISMDWKDRINVDLNYSVRVTVADSRSRVTKYLNATGQIDEFYVGRELGEIWGYTTAGLIQSANETIADQSYFYPTWGPGDIKYSDVNKDGKIDDGNRTLNDHGDVRVIGNSSPRYSVGFSGMVTWKNFSFNMFWQGVIKRDLVPGQNMMWGVGTRGDNGGAFYQGHDDYWRPADETNILGPNTDAYYAKPYVSTETYKNQVTQTRYIYDAGYFRLKNIQLGYTLRQNFIKKLKIQALRFYISGENLITFDNLPPYIDPETSFPSAANGFLGAIYPMSKSVSVGLNLTF
ncbi:MAG: TonB-dependent receptor [Ginsengibacter sp.]